MEPEGSLPCSQEPSTGACPEPDESSPYHSILYLVRSISILSFDTRVVLPSGLCSSGFLIEVLYAFHFSPVRATCQRIRQSPRLFVTFCNKLIYFYGEDLLDPSPTLKLEDHPLLAVHDCLLNIFVATLLHIWRPSPLPW
jgi:hypothetical protein